MTNATYYQTYTTHIFSLLRNKSYESLGKYISDVGHELFGYAVDDPWIKRVENVETLSKYYGVSVGNGAMGLVSSR